MADTEVSVSERVPLMLACLSKFCGCDVSEFSDVSWSSTVLAARSTSTFTTNCTTPARVTPSSTSAPWSSTSTVPRPRRPVSVLSRKRWTPSDRRTRPLVSVSWRDRRRSETRWRARRKRHKLRTMGCDEICTRSSYIEELGVWSYELVESETAAFGVYGWVSISLRPSVVMLPPPGFACMALKTESMIFDACPFYYFFSPGPEESRASD